MKLKQKITKYLFNDEPDIYEERVFYETYHENGQFWTKKDSIDWEGIYLYRLDVLLNDVWAFIDSPCGLSEKKIKKAIINWLLKYLDKEKVDYKSTLKYELKKQIKGL